MTRHDVEVIQRSLNHFTHKYLAHVAPLRVDGVKGHATNTRLLAVKYYLGYGKRDTSVKSLFVRRLRHPRSPFIYVGSGKHRHRLHLFDARMLAAAFARRRRQRKSAQQNHNTGGHTSGVGNFEGHRVAAWIVPYLQAARRNGWRGVVTSGWRDPAYSESLCYRMCGAPRCPGRCAGRSSNHSGSVYPHGAVDVSDYVRFGQIMRKIGAPLHNSLGAQDPVHFSYQGN